MGAQNSQNLISFYLNSKMYEKFAVKDLETQNKDVKVALQDFAKGLITSYLIQIHSEVNKPVQAHLKFIVKF
jgi:hypothetical protein